MRFEVREPVLTEALPRKVTMGRGRPPLFLDGNLLAVKGSLEAKGFTVLAAKSGKSDPELLAEDLPGRVFVTNNPRDFIYSVSLMDFSIIDISHVSKDPQALANVIDRAWVDYSLKAEHRLFSWC
jgi:hypothetical protein